MKKRIAFVLAGVLVCVGAVIWLIPYAPMPDMDGFWNVRIWRVNGADMTELTEQVDQTALREVRSADTGAGQTCAAFAEQLFDG